MTQPDNFIPETECPRCGGDGLVNGGQCPLCGGSGNLYTTILPPGEEEPLKTCPTCDGDGTVPAGKGATATCPTCGGSGDLPVTNSSGGGVLWSTYAAATEADYQQQLIDNLTGTAPVGSLTPLAQIFENVLNEVLGWLSGLVDLPGIISALDTLLQWFYGILDRSGFLALLDSIGDLFGAVFDVFDGSIIEAVLKFLGGIWSTFGELLDIIATPILNILNSIFDALGESFEPFLSFISEVITWLFDTFGDVLETILKPIFTLVAWAIELIIGLIDLDGFKSLVTSIVTPLSAIFSAESFAAAFNSAMKAFAEVVDAFDDVGSWVKSIPLVGPLVSALTGQTEADGVVLGLGTLAGWAGDVLTGKTPIPAANLTGQIPQGLLSLIPVANINIESANLLGQGSFATAATINAADGWSWDNSTNDPDNAAAKGSAKLVTDSTARQLYSRQAVKVAEGDKINLSVRVKTSGYSGGSSSIVLSVIPYVGTTAQAEVVFATRGASNGAWVTMTGTAANRDPYVVPAGVTSLITKIGVTSDSGSGSTVWFDNVDMRKEGLLGQNLVEYLLEAWGGVWTSVYGTSGAGKIWSDFVTAVTAINFDAGEALENAGDAAADVLGVIDSIGKAVFGESTFNTLPAQVKTTLQHFIGKLFGVNTVQDELTDGVIPPLDASVIDRGMLNTDRINTGEVGAEINPTAGSGALLTRVSSNPKDVTSGRNLTPDGFFTNLTVGSSDIQCLKTDGTAGTGNNPTPAYAGAFKVTAAGWYLVELCYRMNTGFGTGGMNVATVLYKGTTLAMTSSNVYKVGGDMQFIWGYDVRQRFVQNSFIVYLEANDIVRSGADITYNGMASPSLGGESGSGTSASETYFSISLLNKTFAG